ncbi:MAG: trypsin-like peptidase domain-containing protein [Limisphaerales bacterium]
MQRPRLILLVALGALTATAAPADPRRDPCVEAVQRVLPAVVNIATFADDRADPYEQMLREFFGYRRRAPDTPYSSGSGVIIDEEGWILTNQHVVRDSARIRVTLADGGEPLDAKLVAASDAHDLALLRLEAPTGRRFRAVPFADPGDLLLGETVVALGNPFGLGGSVSRGILSAKTRRPERDGENMDVADWLQTDAAINPGNSGGPLINLRGELIGLNVAILRFAQGIGFAIPVSRIDSALAEMMSPELTRSLWFGATLRGMKPPIVITALQRGSPADTAGLEPSDEVMSVNGRPARSALQVYRELGADAPEAKFVVLRGDQRRDVAVRLLPESSVFNAEYLRRRTGLALDRVPDDLARELRLDPASSWLITGVERGSPAEAAGLARSQVVIAFDGQPAMELTTVGRQLNRRPRGEALKLDVLAVRRRGALLQVTRGTVTLALR